MKDIPWRLAKATTAVGGLACFKHWFNTEMPAVEPIITTRDAKLKYLVQEKKNGLKQVRKENDDNCYQFIDVQLTYKAPEADVERMRIALDRAYKGNDRGRVKVQLMEVLGLLGLQSVQRIAMIRGKGGNSKSMLAELRHNLFCGTHYYVSSSAMEIADEFRKQCPHFAFARALTIQECSTLVRILSEIFKKFVSGEMLPGRCNFGKETFYFSWPLAALFW
jgi:phage/plasmid-associated DNA primase